MAVIAPLSGFLLNRRGLHVTLLIGLLAVCLASIPVSVADNLWLLFIDFGVIGGVVLALLQFMRSKLSNGQFA